MRVNGSGLSMKSMLDGKPAYDAGIELKFLENDTYFVIVKGTSQAVSGQEKVVITATGTCDNLPQKTEQVPREITIPLKVIFGPYPGTTTDKVLQQTDTKETTNPVTNEKSTITIDFSLTRK